MKKFIIGFDYKGFLFSAKVMVKRCKGKIIISTTLVDNHLTFLLNNGQLLFIQREKGFQMVLLNEDGSFEVLDWNVSHEYVDKSEMVDLESFSMS